jgi:hypothetical protein
MHKVIKVSVVVLTLIAAGASLSIAQERAAQPDKKVILHVAF